MNTPSKPITLRAEEVRELQEKGAVTIRRAVKPQPGPGLKPFGVVTDSTLNLNIGKHLWLDNHPCTTKTHYVRSPFGPPGTVMWVRETWAHVPMSDKNGEYDGEAMGYIYRADGESAFDQMPEEWEFSGKWRSSTSMPQNASRLSMQVTKQTVEQENGVWFWVVEGRKV